MTLFLLLLAFASTLSAFIFYSLLFLLKSFDMRNSIWTNIFVWFSISLLVIKDIVAGRDETAHSLLLKMKNTAQGFLEILFFVAFVYSFLCETSDLLFPEENNSNILRKWLEWRFKWFKLNCILLVLVKFPLNTAAICTFHQHDS